MPRFEFHHADVKQTEWAGFKTIICRLCALERRICSHQPQSAFGLRQNYWNLFQTCKSPPSHKLANKSALFQLPLKIPIQRKSPNLGVWILTLRLQEACDLSGLGVRLMQCPGAWSACWRRVDESCGVAQVFDLLTRCLWCRLVPSRLDEWCRRTRASGTVKITT